MKRALFTASLVVCIVVGLMLGAPARAAQSNPIQVRVEAGYDGYFRAGQWTPLLISISNTGADVSGELRVSSNSTSGLAANAYATDITLPTQSSKLVPLNVRLLDFANSVQVELITGDGIIATVNSAVKLVPSSDILYAVVTESPRGVVDLQTSTGVQGSVYQANWRVESVPRYADGLGGLDGLLLTDADTGNLNADQRQAIREWVIAGGHLVVTGGPNWQKTQAGVSELLPLTPASAITLTSLPSVAQYSGITDAPLQADAPIVVAQGTLANDAVVLAQETGTPILVRHQVGEGYVDYLAIDPGTEPILSWKDRSRFWVSVMTTADQRPSWSFGVTDPDQASLSADFIKGLRLPDVLQLLGFLMVYIVLIGPVNYLVLRWLKRPELAWFTIPLIVIATSVYTYATGFSLRGTLVTINRLSLVQVWPNSDRAEVDGVVGILAPRRANYDLTVRNNMTLQTLTNTAAAINPALTSNMTIYEGSTYEARNVPVDAGTTAAFLVEGYTPVTPIQGLATLQLAKASNGTVFKVKLTNTSGMTLTDTVALCMGATYRIGTLAAGEEIEFTLDINDVAASRATQNNFVPQLSSYTGYNDTSYRERTIQDLLGSAYYYQQGRGLGSSLEDQENWRRQTFLRSLAMDSDPGGGRGANVYIAGWTATSPIDVDLNGVGFITEDSTLWVHRLPVQIVPATSDGFIEVPSGFTTWTVSEDSKLQDAAPYNLPVRQDEDAIFRFSPLPALRTMTISEVRLRLMMSNNVPQNAKVSMWNWTSKQWEPINLGGKFNVSLTGADATKFVGPGNTVELRAEADSGTYVFYDVIEVYFYGKFNQ